MLSFTYRHIMTVITIISASRSRTPTVTTTAITITLLPSGFSTFTAVDTASDTSSVCVVIVETVVVEAVIVLVLQSVHQVHYVLPCEYGPISYYCLITTYSSNINKLN